MSGNPELRTESGHDAPASASSVIATAPRDLVATNVAAELERHAAQAERCMARARQALRRLDVEAGERGPGGLLGLARKAATAAVAADAALEHLSDATRSAFGLEEQVDFLLAARAVLDTLRESSQLLEAFAEAARARCGTATWPEVTTSSAALLAG
jgi:hypothetical protein